MSQVIIVGGGLAGLSAAHTVLERGGTVCIIDKNAFLGALQCIYPSLYPGISKKFSTHQLRRSPFVLRWQLD